MDVHAVQFRATISDVDSQRTDTLTLTSQHNHLHIMRDKIETYSTASKALSLFVFEEWCSADVGILPVVSKVP